MDYCLDAGDGTASIWTGQPDIDLVAGRDPGEDLAVDRADVVKGLAARGCGQAAADESGSARLECRSPRVPVGCCIHAMGSHEWDSITSGSTAPGRALTLRTKSKRATLAPAQ